MRTMILVIAGVAIWLVCFAVVRWRGDPRHVLLPRVTIGFVLGWLLVAAANLWIGVARAGYGVTEELPILLLVFLLPSTLAVVTSWRERGRAKRVRHDTPARSID